MKVQPKILLSFLLRPFAKCWSFEPSQSVVQNEEHVSEMRSFDRGSLPLSVYLADTDMIKS